MARKIGPLSIIGFFVLILSEIVYFSSFTYTYSFQDLLIGIGGILLGFVFMIIDFILIKKKDSLNEIHPRITIFGIIVGVGIFIWIIDLLFLSTVIGAYVLFIGGIVCILVILPVITVGLAIFLIFVRTPLSKTLTRKNVTIFCVIMGIVLLILPTYFIWPSVSPTYNGNLWANQISFSSDNARLFVHSEGSQIVTVEPHPGFLATYQVWNLSSGTLLWNTTSSQNAEMMLSPDGEFLSNADSKSIFSLQSNTSLGTYVGDYFVWVMNRNSFITADETQLYVWDATHVTITKTIAYPNASQIIPSYDGSRIAVVPQGKGEKTLSVIGITLNNATYLFNTSVSETLTSVVWSPDGTKLQLTSWIRQIGYHNNLPYQVSVWDPRTTRLIQNTSFIHYYGEQGDNELLEIWFGEFVINDFDHKQIIVYNFTGEKEHIYGYDSLNNNVVWSNDKTLMAYQKQGEIEIINTSTGKIVRGLPLPIYELKRSIPGFEGILVFCAIAFFVVLRHKRQKN
jgi:hypothetical protein